MSFTASLEQIVEENANGLLSKHPTWCRVQLSEVADILNGFPFPSSSFSRDAGMPLLRIRDILSTSTEAFFAGDFDSTYIVELGDLVIGMDGDFNAALWRGPRALLNQRVCKITPDERFYSKKFLAYVLPGYLSAINERTSSITVKHLSSRTIAEIPLPLPPLAEQKRIVDEIEKQFTRIEAATAGLRRAWANLKAFRAAILKAACEGRLIPTGPGAATDRAALPNGWSWVRMPSIGQLGRGVSKHRPRNDPSLFGGDYPFIQTGEVRRSNGWIRNYSTTYNDKGLAQSRLWPKGTLCITIAASIAETGILTLPACFPDSVVGFVYDGDPVTVRYIEIFFRTVKAEIARFAPATAQKNINLETLSQISIPLPPLAEQQRIVAEVDRRFSILDELDHAVDINLSRADQLKRSILLKAFEGRLVPQDPSEESASTLLTRLGETKEKRPSNREMRPRRDRGIKPGVSTPGSEPQHPPKPRRGAGNNVRESASAPSGLPDESGDASLGLKPQALRPGPFRATPTGGNSVTRERSSPTGKTEEGQDFLGLSREEQIDHVWESLLGLGAVEKDEAIRTVANDLREKGLAQFQRLRQGGALYEAISSAIDRGVRAGSFDRPRRGTVRALLPDAREYSPEEWRRCLLVSLNNHAIDEEDALRSAAEWARENMGLEFSRLREDGVILRGLREALNDAIRRGEIQRKHGQIRVP